MPAMLSLQEPRCVISFCQHNVPLGVIFHFYKLGRERLLNFCARKTISSSNLIKTLSDKKDGRLGRMGLIMVGFWQKVSETFFNSL